MARPSGRPLRDEIIDTALRLVQQRGVNGFSYGLVATELGIKSPSIHHHFRTKEDLVAAVAVDYRRRFTELVSAIDGLTSVDRLLAYSRLYTKTAQADRFCFCGAVASEWLTVGDKPKAEVQRFFQDQTDFLETQFSAGVDAHEFRADLDVPATASALLASLEGALLLSRADGSVELPDTVGALLLGLAVRSN